MLIRCQTLIFQLAASILFVFICSAYALPGRQTDRLFIAADTASFSPNSSQGWSRTSVYLNQVTTDSVDFEIIIQRNGKIAGPDEKLIGIISNQSFVPAVEQQVSYQLLIGNLWRIRITTSGQCYISQTVGTYIPGNSYILPVKIRYKNK